MRFFGNIPDKMVQIVIILCYTGERKKGGHENMKKNTSLYIAIGLSAALLAGCQKEDIIQPIDVETTVAETTVEETTTETATEESKAIPD